MNETEQIPGWKPTWEYHYLLLLEDILRTGDDRVDRTGVGTRAVFGRTLDIDLRFGFPAVTTKKLAMKSVTAELLWFLEGSSDERRLAEILYGHRNGDSTIWTENAEAEYWKPKAQFDGDLGRVYGVQWRRWRKFELYDRAKNEQPDLYAVSEEIDQVEQVVRKVKTNDTDRRMIMTAWNVGELDQMALPPCHMLAQFFVRNSPQGKLLSCQMYQRSVDVMLGLPFNIASYALLTHLIAHSCGMGVDRLIMNLGDTHIYSNHLDGAETQLERQPFAPPKLRLNPTIPCVEDFKMSDIELTDYQYHPPIKLQMAV